MPNERLESTSLKVGHKRGGVNLFPFPFFCHSAFHFLEEVSSVTSAKRFFACAQPPGPSPVAAHSELQSAHVPRIPEFLHIHPHAAPG